MATVESIRLVGYARVSTMGQETHLQIDALKKAGVSVIYQEKLALLALGLSFIGSWIPWAKVIAWSFTRWIVSPVL